MPAESCVFCRIVRGELPATVVNRGHGFVAIEDISPKAPVHVLVVPERHLDSFREIGDLGPEESRAMLEFVRETAELTGVDDYRLIVNVGPGAGQTVFHLHWHILGGKELPFP